MRLLTITKPTASRSSLVHRPHPRTSVKRM
ncbi:hypothetical protein OESDEN_23098 [Oesophagostomum dentatum]|uniref:Uncharacterized protein n=1 Tax=Oesophagostomum dentatum TaxID=61180 RepID=A0A0B1S1A5_OESDE|nr:hypothetical protein OESDEN_23098 [Oesophagostomum dentatum]